MTLSRFLSIALLALALSAPFQAPASATGVKLFEKQDGVWKATCFKEQGDDTPYCRVMVVKVFKDGARTGNFIQFGPAWDRGQTGVVVASYLGFTRESKIRVRVDDGEPWVIGAPMENHVIVPADVAETMVETMKAGETVHLRFKPATGVWQELEFPLAGFPGLVEAIQPILDGAGK